MPHQPWFQGSTEGHFPTSAIVQALGDPGIFFAEVTGYMPGISTSRLVDQEGGTIQIDTNEGRMTHTNVTVMQGDDAAAVEFDESYKAGKRVEVTAHHLHRFRTAPDGTICDVVITDVKAPGLIGSFYRRFGAKNIGSAIPNAYAKFGAAHA